MAALWYLRVIVFRALASGKRLVRVQVAPQPVEELLVTSVVVHNSLEQRVSWDLTGVGDGRGELFLE